MTFSIIVFSAIFALIFAAMLALGFRRRGPGPANGVLYLFLIIFMFTWAFGSWMKPIGPIHWDVSWLGYLLIAFFLMLLLGALIPPSTPRKRIISKSDLDEEVRKDKASTSVEVTFGIFFWFMIIALFVLAIISLFRQETLQAIFG
jgi:Ca2+/Na+ antiporter